MTYFFILLWVGLVTLCGYVVQAATKPVDPSNSYSQGLTQADEYTARKIRMALAKDDSLSLKAKSVTVLVKEGLVTLEGTVKTVAESDRIEKIAADLVGRKAVFNNLIVSNGS